MNPEEVAEAIRRHVWGCRRYSFDVWKFVDGTVEVVVPCDGEVMLRELNGLERELREHLRDFEVAVSTTHFVGTARDERHRPVVVVRYRPR